MIVTFTDLLHLGGLDPKRVVLMRHRVQGRAIHEIWRTERSLVEAYQSRQNPECFGVGKKRATHLACFLAGHGGRTVFGGMYEVGDYVPAAPDDADPITGHANTGDRMIWDLASVATWAQYEDRLVIDWGKGFISWRQWASRSTPKPVLEIADQHETPFPGWSAFRCQVDELATLPGGWRGALAANRGIYLLVDLDDRGRFYVGSAKGAESLLGRLQGYAEGGTNGNRGLTKGHRYQVSILEVAGTGASDHTLEMVESHWKDKLGTRKYGLNQN